MEKVGTGFLKRLFGDSARDKYNAHIDKTLQNVKETELVKYFFGLLGKDEKNEADIIIEALFSNDNDLISSIEGMSDADKAKWQAFYDQLAGLNPAMRDSVKNKIKTKKQLFDSLKSPEIAPISSD